MVWENSIVNNILSHAKKNILTPKKRCHPIHIILLFTRSTQSVQHSNKVERRQGLAVNRSTGNSDGLAHLKRYSDTEVSETSPNGIVQ